MPQPASPPQHILIIGAGEFGLSTALTLLRRQASSTSTSNLLSNLTHITLLETSPSLPNPHGSSVDASRIIRADYSNRLYSRLAAEAQELWRDKSSTGWGGEGRYSETGFLLGCDLPVGKLCNCQRGNGPKRECQACELCKESCMQRCVCKHCGGCRRWECVCANKPEDAGERRWYLQGMGGVRYVRGSLGVVKGVMQEELPDGKTTVEQAGLSEGRYARKGVQELTGGWKDVLEVSGLNLGGEKVLAEEKARIEGEMEEMNNDMEMKEYLRPGEEMKVDHWTQEVGRLGNWGYVNWNSGWADAEKVVRYVAEMVEKEGGGGGDGKKQRKVTIRTGATVKRLLSEKTAEGKSRVTGVQLAASTGGEGTEAGADIINADLVIVAAGAWSPSLVDLQGRCVATGQVLSYLSISETESAQLSQNPTVMNLSEGTFIIPPLKGGRELKIARHGFGYRRMVDLVESDDILMDDSDLDPEGTRAEEGGKLQLKVSIPIVGVQAMNEGQQACRSALRRMLPEAAERKFTNTRICWYCDTPNGDFLIDWHPTHEGLFLATGGSGHGFKFFPVIGEKIVDALEGKLDAGLRQAWSWRKERIKDFQACEDGSRAGPRGMMWMTPEQEKEAAKVGQQQLTDYQMQMMLLEQQTRKRLMMMRCESPDTEKKLTPLEIQRQLMEMTTADSGKTDSKL